MCEKARLATALCLCVVLAVAHLPFAERAEAADPAPTDAAIPSADELLAASDLARGGNVGGLTFNATLTSYRDEKVLKSYSMLIESDGENSLASFTEPARSKGLSMLMRGRNMWFLSPDTKRPVPISPRQRLLGEASNGDIATTNYSRDYSAEILGEETVDGTPCYVLMLEARGQGVTYAKLRYYVSRDDLLGIKAEYLTAAGKVIKTAFIEYENTLIAGGRELNFVSEMRVVDDINSRDSTVMRYSDVKAGDVPANRFDARSLMRG